MRMKWGEKGSNDENGGMGNGTFKQKFFENTITFVSKTSPDHSLISTFQSSTTLILEDLQ